MVIVLDGTTSVDLEVGAPGERLICDLDGVRGGDTGFAVQLIVAEDNRVLVRSINEGGFSCSDVDLLDLLGWVQRLAPVGLNLNEITTALAVFAARKRAG